MNSWWLEFADGSFAGCDGESAYDAKAIAEYLSGKTVAGGSYRDIKAWQLPYPCRDMIWQYEHPVVGKCPPFCSTPAKCAGRSACPKKYACSE